METFVNARWLLAAALLPVACGREESVVRIADFESRSPLAVCERMEGDDRLASVTSLRPASDTTLLVVDPSGRQVALVDRNGRVLLAHEFPEEGPGSISRLADAAISGDTLLVVTDAGRNRVMGLSLDGSERWALELAFPPQNVAFAGDRLLIAALGMDPRIPGLVLERRDADFEPIGVPFIHEPDALARMFANSVSLYGLADGSAVVAHELVHARAWRVPPAGPPVRASIPVAEAVAHQIGYMPPMPLREEDLDDVATPVISLTLDEVGGDLFFLTRSGRRADGYLEKAVVRASADFSYLGSMRLPFNATEIALLRAEPDSLIIVDPDLRWHRCPVPDRAVD